MKPSLATKQPEPPVLFAHYPGLKNRLAWMPLAALPTPLQPLLRPEIDNLWIKRDDLSSGIYGGNKVRKLEFILALAQRKHTRRLITFGGIGTHHGLATAIFCKRLGIACTLLLYRQPVTEQVRQNLLLLKNCGARLVYSKTMGRAVLSYFLFERLKHPGAYFLFAGGSNPIGTIGFVNAAFELKAQIRQGLMPEPAVIFCPLGSGGTLAGLALGTRLAGLHSRLIGVRVTASHLGPFQACTSGTVRKLMQDTYACLKQGDRDFPEIVIKSPQIFENYFGRGYGHPTPEGARASRMLQDKTGILLEPTYTAKTFAAVLDYCRLQRSGAEPVLYWHTYNSVDLSQQAAAVSYRDLPKVLQGLIKTESITAFHNSQDVGHV